MILHVDMDAFYAAVEQRAHPEWRGKPVVVGAPPEERGVVAAASYEARKFHIRSAMPMSQALRLCPEAIRVSPNFAAYKAASDVIHAIFREETPRVEPVSLDEAYLDVSEPAPDFPAAEVIGRRIKANIKRRTQLNASVGIGPNKFLAKIASDYDKPDGFFVIRPEDVLDFLAPLPVRVIPGVGPKTERRLHLLGIETIGLLRAQTLKALQDAVGQKHGAQLYELARGIDESPVVSHWIRKSLSQEQTFAQDLWDRNRMRAILRDLSREVAEGLAQERLAGRTVGIKVRFHDFRIATRALTLDHPTRDEAEIRSAALYLLDRLDMQHRRVRLLGVRVSGFDSPRPKGKQSTPRDRQMTFW
ncbi:MAG TPA: DNA polymerase IV [bacterium]|nr:DNA polymerase IV [bacterium]